MQDLLAVFRRTDVRVIVIAVVLGESIANLIRTVIQFVTGVAFLLGQPGRFAGTEGWQWRLPVSNAAFSLILWGAVAVGCLVLLRGLLAGPQQDIQ